MDWPGLVRKYIWDEERTPYLVGSGRLTARQARSELFVYAFFLTILASVVAALAFVEGAFATPLAGLYGVSIVLAAVVLGVNGHPAAAAYCATAPVALGVAALLGVLRPGMTAGEMALLGLASAVWFRYALRVVKIARGLRDRA